MGARDSGVRFKVHDEAQSKLQFKAQLNGSGPATATGPFEDLRVAAGPPFAELRVELRTQWRRGCTLTCRADLR
eukprot:15476306-Alexandrium_andersonii.AAC.1